MQYSPYQRLRVLSGKAVHITWCELESEKLFFKAAVILLLGFVECSTVPVKCFSWVTEVNNSNCFVRLHARNKAFYTYAQ